MPTKKKKAVIPKAKVKTSPKKAAPKKKVEEEKPPIVETAVTTPRTELKDEGHQKDFFDNLPFTVSNKDFNQTIVDLKSWKKLQDHNKTKVAFTLLAVREEQTFRQKGYNKMDDFIRDELGFSSKGASSMMRFAQKYKEMGLDPKLVDRIRESCLSKLISKINSGAITEQEAKDKFVPMIVEGGKDVVPRSKFDEIMGGVGSKVEDVASIPPVKLGTFKGAQAKHIRTCLQVLTGNEDYEHNSEEKLDIRELVVDLFINASKDIKAVSKAQFNQVISILKIINMQLPPGVTAGLDVYDEDIFKDELSQMDEYLPESADEDILPIQLDIREFITKVVDERPKNFVNIKTLEIYKGMANPDPKAWKEASRVIIAQELIDPEAHVGFKIRPKEVAQKEKDTLKRKKRDAPAKSSDTLSAADKKKRADAIMAKLRPLANAKIRAELSKMLTQLGVTRPDLTQAKIKTHYSSLLAAEGAAGASAEELSEDAKARVNIKLAIWADLMLVSKKG